MNIGDILILNGETAADEADRILDEGWRLKVIEETVSGNIVVKVVSKWK